MKIKAFILLLFFSVSGILYAAGIQESEYLKPSGEIILLHTNDFHGAIFPNNDQGGLANMSSYVRAVRAVNPHVLLLDAGDFNSGGAMSNMFDALPDILGFNLMGYDGVVFGNHEFDGDMQKLETQMAKANFDFISSNIKITNGTTGGDQFLGNQYIIRQYGDITVGIFGITTTVTTNIANPDDSLVFLNEIESARIVVDILRNTEEVDIVIGLTHLGDTKYTQDFITSIDLAQAVPGIDIIVDGHSHTFMQTPIRAGDTWVVSAGDWGRFIGHGRLIIRNGRLLEFIWAPISIGPDREILTMLSPFIAEADNVLKVEIGTAAGEFDNTGGIARFGETAIGNMISDASAWFLKTKMNQEVDFVFHNAGGIRAGLSSGVIAREDILTILPFNNILILASMTGTQIIELFDHIAAITLGSGAIPQFSGDVRFTIDKTVGNGIIKDLTIGGDSVDPNRIYRFATNDYLMNGGDGYEILSIASDAFDTSQLVSDVVIEYIKELGTITPAVDGRMNIITGN